MNMICFHLLAIVNSAAINIGIATRILYKPFHLNLTTALHCRY